MKLASLIYLPPLTVAGSRTGAALANLMAWKHTHPIYVYSDADWHPSVIRALEPAKFFRIPNPEVVRSETVHHVPKLVYLYGLEIAKQEGLEYFLTLENDSRVWGHDWDQAIFEEFLVQDGAVLGGTIFCWHPFNFGLDYAQAFSDFIIRANYGFLKRPVILPQVFVYGGKGSCERHPPCAYPNGAGSIVRTEFARRCFGEREIKAAAVEGTAWDAHLGFSLFEQYGPWGYDRVASLHSVFSVYGDLLTSETMRQNLLTSGQVRLAHQIKSDWKGIPE